MSDSEPLAGVVERVHSRMVFPMSRTGHVEALMTQFADRTVRQAGADHLVGEALLPINEEKDYLAVPVELLADLLIVEHQQLPPDAVIEMLTHAIDGGREVLEISKAYVALMRSQSPSHVVNAFDRVVGEEVIRVKRTPGELAEKAMKEAAAARQRMLKQAEAAEYLLDAKPRLLTKERREQLQQSLALLEPWLGRDGAATERIG